MTLITDPLDTRESPIAGELRLLDALEGALCIEQDVIGDAVVAVERES